jgi:hypothetical protein
MQFWTAFWAVVTPVALLIFAFVRFYRQDLSARLSKESET